MAEPVRIPGDAVADDATDLAPPAQEMLRALDLLAKQGEKGDGFASTFAGPPQSIALIEAGATAAAKWWATGLGAMVAATWVGVNHWFSTIQAQNVKIAVLAGAAFITAALIVSIAHLLASDVRGRAAAAVATIEARARVAELMIVAAAEVSESTPPASPTQLVAMPPGTWVRNHDAKAGDVDRWLAVAAERDANGTHRYWLRKGAEAMTVDEQHVEV